MICIVDGIILAAGLSTRMGVAKLTLEFDDEPLIARVVREALRSALGRVILVMGRESERLVSALGPLASDVKLKRLVNPTPENGMSSSLHVGVAAVQPNATATMVILADQPFLTAEIIDMLIAEHNQAPQKIIRPAIRDRATTPVVFPSDLFPQLLATTGDVGGRDVVDRNRHRVVQCEMGPVYDDTDLDTPADLQKATARARTSR